MSLLITGGSGLVGSEMLDGIRRKPTINHRFKTA
jgi:hypothetical protein